MATEDYCEQCRVFPDFRSFPPSPPRLPFSPSPPWLPVSPSLPQIQEHDDILVYPDASTVTPPYVARGLEAFLTTYQEVFQDFRPFSPSPPPLQLSPSLPQNQEHDDILVHPDASTVTPPYVAGGSEAFWTIYQVFPDFHPFSPSPPPLQFPPSSPRLPFSLSLQGVDESVDGRTIGKLFVSNREIAKGSNGTIVLEGTHEVRPVAVKRLVKAYHDVAGL